MSAKSQTVTVATTATRLDSTSDLASGAKGQSFTFYNLSAQTVYVGGSDVTTANGFPVSATSYGPGVDLEPGDGVYGIVAATTAEVRTFEVGL